MTQLTFEPIYGSVLLALLAVMVTVTVVLMVTPPTSDASQRRWLVGLRLAAAAMLILALLRPTLVRTDNRPADAAIIVAVDASRSMTLPDGDGGDRWTTQVAAWRSLAQRLSGQDQTLTLRLLTYHSQTQLIASASGEALDGITPDGELTDLATAMSATIGAAGGQPIAGIVMMGDGTQTAPIEGSGAQRVVETLDSLGVPLWTVPIGPAGGDASSRDVAIDALPESLRLFAGNQVDVSFQVLSRGLAGKDIPVRLKWIAADGSSTETAVRRIGLSRASEMVSVTIPVTAPAAGTYRLQVQADQQDGELVVTNNTQISFVDVREGGGRILYLLGNLDQEQSLLRRSLRRFPDLDLTYRWIPADTSAGWPIDTRDWFTQGKYDIYILGDLDSAAIAPDQWRALAEVVDGGSGLVTLGGFHAYGGGGYTQSPLASVLPITMRDGVRRTPGKLIPPEARSDESRSDRDQIPGPLSIRLARNHPITDLGGPDPSQVWSDLPPLLGANRMGAPKVAPGVDVLLQSPDDDPLLVVGTYGRGRVASIAFDSSWRWWRDGQSEAHRRFWRQLTLWLLSREESSGDQIVVELDDRRFAVGQSPSFAASLSSLDRAAGGAARANLVAEVIDEEGNVREVETIASGGTGDSIGNNSGGNNSGGTNSGGTGGSAIRGPLPSLGAGIYRLRIRAEAGAGAAAETAGLPEPQEVAFQVVDESRELALPMADPVFLGQLADLTRDHGGAAFTADSMDELAATILEKRKQAEMPIVDKFRLGDGPRTGWLLFTLFAAAMSAEWFLRRRWGLA